MVITLGMMASLAHSTPNTSVSFFRLCVAASRMEKTVSPSHPMHRLLSFSSKNLTPSWLASRGMYSMMARRTRHCLSSARLTMAGSSETDRGSMPMTFKSLAYQGFSRFHGMGHSFVPWLTSSSFEMMWSLTSGNSSLSIWRNMGRRWSIVLWRMS